MSEVTTKWKEGKCDNYNEMQLREDNNMKKIKKKNMKENETKKEKRDYGMLTWHVQNI